MVVVLVVADETVLPAAAGVLAARNRRVGPEGPGERRHRLVLDPVERVEDALPGVGPRVRFHVPEKDVPDHGANIDPRRSQGALSDLSDARPTLGGVIRIRQMSPMPTSKDVEQLLREAERYLGAVEVFRAEGREPVWR